MKKRKHVVSILLVASMLLGMSGCGQNPEEERKAVSASTTGSAVSGQAVSESSVQEEKVKKHVSTEVEQQEDGNEIEEPVDINEIDWAAYENKMTAEEYAILQEYMSVLAENETFIWLKEEWEEKREEYSYKKKKVTLQQFLEYQYKDAGIDDSPSMIVNSIALCNVFQSGKKDLILHIENMGWEYLILHYENDKLYGIDMPERCFEMLQENGIYYGHGGASTGQYYRMSIENGVIEETMLAERDWGKYHIAGKKVSEKEFLKWEEKNCVEEVEYYAPTKMEKLEE